MQQRPPIGVTSFRLSSLMLVVVLVSLCLAIGRLVPWLGILATAIVVPAHLRTAFAANEAAAAGKPLSISGKVGLFLQSVTVVVWTGIFIGSAFFFGGSVVFLLAALAERLLPLDGIGYMLGIIFGLITSTGSAAVVGGIVIKSIWPIGMQFEFETQQSSCDPR